MLSVSFEQWLSGKETELESSYNKITKLMASEFEIETVEVKNFLRKKLNHSFFILPALTTYNNDKRQFQCIFYDAYSSSTSPSLWEKTFLSGFLDHFSGTECVFTTYAATSVLTKCLSSQNFKVIKRKGFGFKRESTIAIKSPKTN